MTLEAFTKLDYNLLNKKFLHIKAACTKTLNSSDSNRTCNGNKISITFHEKVCPKNYKNINTINGNGS